MKTHRRRALACFLAGWGLLVLAGCNTMEGLGKDLEKAGEKISEAADRAND